MEIDGDEVVPFNVKVVPPLSHSIINTCILVLLAPILSHIVLSLSLLERLSEMVDLAPVVSKSIILFT